VHERDARMALCCVIEAGSRDEAAVVDQYGAEAVWQTLLRPTSASRWAARAQAFELTEAQAATERHGLRFVVPGDDECCRRGLVTWPMRNPSRAWVGCRSGCG
jgi:DNA processing protein